MENEGLHNRMMSILHQRAANGEGDDYGGWAKNQVINKKQYVNMMKTRGYTEEQAEDKYKILRIKRKKQGKTITRGIPRASKSRTTTTKKGHTLSEWQQFMRDNKDRGLSLRELSQEYQFTKGKRYFPYAPEYITPGMKEVPSIDEISVNEKINLLDNAADILSEITDDQGRTPSNIVDTVNTIKKITTKYTRPSGKPIPPGMMQTLLRLEKWREINPEYAKDIDTQIHYELAKGKGDLDYDDYYDMY
jgi:hypothetical protein